MAPRASRELQVAELNARDRAQQARVRSSEVEEVPALVLLGVDARSSDDVARSSRGAGDTIGLMPEGRALTYQDLLDLPDDGLRRELLDGEPTSSSRICSACSRRSRVSLPREAIDLDSVGVRSKFSRTLASIEFGSARRPEILEAGDDLIYGPLPGLVIDVATLFDR